MSSTAVRSNDLSISIPLSVKPLAHEVLGILIAESWKYAPGQEFQLRYVVLRDRLDDYPHDGRIPQAIRELTKWGVISRRSDNDHTPSWFVVHYDRIRFLGLLPEWAS